MKYTLFAVMLHAFSVLTQTTADSLKLVEKSAILRGAQWTLALHGGYNQVRVSPISGEVKNHYQNAWSMAPSMHLGFSHFLYKGLFAEANGGFGAYSFREKYDLGGNLSSKDYPRLWTLQHFFYTQMDLGLGYAHYISDRLLLRHKIGWGRRSEMSHSTGTWSSQTDDKLDIVGQIVAPAVKANILLFSTGLQFRLPSANLLGLELFYRHSTTNVYSGNYYFIQQNAHGKFSSTGSSLGVGLNYVFTRAQKRVVTQGFSDKVEKRDHKRAFLSQRRQVQAGSTFIAAHVGLMFNKTSVKDVYGNFGSVAFPGTLFQLHVEHLLTAKNYFEGGAQAAEYWSGIRMRNQGAHGTNAFWSAGLTGGIGHRLTSQNNYHWANISLGASVQFNLNPGVQSWGGMTSNEPSSLSYTYEDEVRTTVFPTFYLSLSKDFQITKRAYITLKFTRHQGIFPVYVSEYKVNTGSTNYNMDGRIYGTASNFSVGFKYNCGGLFSRKAKTE